MKEAMKKADIMLYHRDVDQMLEDLQDKGIVHVDIHDLQEDEEVSIFLSEINKIDDMLKTIDPHHKQIHAEHIIQIINQYDAIEQELAELKEEKENVHKQFRVLKPWGKVDWTLIENIEDRNWRFSFYVAPANNFSRVADNEDVFEINRIGGNVYFTSISSLEKESKLPFEELTLPRVPLGEIGSQLNGIEEKIARLEEEKFHLGRYREDLLIYKDKLLDELNLLKVTKALNTEGDGRLKLATIWFPKRKEESVRAFLNERDIHYELSSPEKEDHVPVVLKNNAYTRIFENITKVYQLPNYRELDLTPFIGVFYPIFFAYCLGDAGYGFVLTVLALWALIGPLKDNKGVAALGIILGIMTTAVGIFKSGTLFGLSISEIRDIPMFDTLSQYIFITDDQDFVFNAFNVSLMIGLFQILVGVILSFIRKIVYEGFLFAIPMAAKFVIIFSSVAIFLGASQGVEIFVPYVDMMIWLLVAGISILLFTHDYSISPIKRALSGILEVFFVFTGILGDSLSYIRLFALGVSSSILGLVVNQIGAPLLEGGIFSIVGGVIFLVFGHTLNFAIASLGALIHPLRLTFVEFYGNAQFEGGGKEFKTFKKTTRI